MNNNKSNLIIYINFTLLTILLMSCMASKPHFSKSIERTLSIGSMQFMIDFDTGKTMDAPASASRDTSKMDAYADHDQPYHEPSGLIGMNLHGLKVQPKQWNDSPQKLLKVLEENKTNKLMNMNINDREISPTFYFQTQDGTCGILQILGITDKPKGIRIRYKIIDKDNL